MLLHLKQHQLHLQSAAPLLAMLTCSPTKSDEFSEVFGLFIYFFCSTFERK